MTEVPRISIFGRRELSQPRTMDGPSLLVAIRDPGSEEPVVGFAVGERLDLEFDDVSYLSDVDLVFTLEMATAIVSRITGARFKNIIISCEFGVSRSAGVAAAIEEFFTNTASSIWFDSRYEPNRLVHRVLADALSSATSVRHSPLFRNSPS